MMMEIETKAPTGQPGYGEFQVRSGGRMGFVSQGTGTPVMLMLGSLCDFRYWEPQIDAIAKLHLCITLSMTHYWSNPLPGQAHRFSWDCHVDELAELIAVEASGGAHIVGHSRGGHVAFQLAVRYPSLVRTLTLADPAGTIEFGRSTSPSLPHAVNALRARSAALIGIGEREQGLRLFVDSVSRPGFWDRSTDEFKEMAFANAHTVAL
ncbi:alpha/beta fold hydrolase [Paraburkholderia sediminicola]|uniref:alpha/beta fold hydrolase n=1 Tax=Paraburkholderia sediminicola TaxID=458836 RepID=UPI0038BA6AB3